MQLLRLAHPELHDLPEGDRLAGLGGQGQGARLLDEARDRLAQLVQLHLPGGLTDHLRLVAPHRRRVLPRLLRAHLHEPAGEPAVLQAQLQPFQRGLILYRLWDGNEPEDVTDTAHIAFTQYANDPDVAEAVERWRRETVGDPGRELLGLAQREFLEGALTRSAGRGEPWRVVLNQVMMAETIMPDYMRETPFWLRTGMRLSGGRVWETAQRSRHSVPLTLDDWDGFPAERERVYDMLRRTGTDLLVLTGDTHNFWANQLMDSAGEQRGAEFGVTSVTSPSEFEYVSAPGVDFGQMTVDRNEQVLHHEVYKKGYIHLKLTRERAEADLIAVSTIESRDFTTQSDSRWAVARTSDGRMGPVERL